MLNLINEQDFSGIENICFVNLRVEILRRWDRNFDNTKCVKNKHTLKLGKYLIIFVDSEISNRILSEYIKYCMSYLPNPTKYNYIISGGETGLRIKVLGEILKQILKEREYEVKIKQINYYKFIEKVFE